MSKEKDSAELKNHLGDLLVYGLILLVLLLAVRAGCVSLTLPFQRRESGESSDALTSERIIQELESRSQLCCAEMDLTVMLMSQKNTNRFLLPDGFMDVSARVPGTVRAAIDLEGLDEGDIEVLKVGGMTFISVLLPPAEVSGVSLDYTDVTWNHSADWLQLLTADQQALLTREELLTEARQVLPIKAVQAGLLLQAEQHAVDVVTSIARELGAYKVEVLIERGDPC